MIRSASRVTFPQSRKQACSNPPGVYVVSVKTQRWLGAWAAMMVGSVLAAQAPTFTRPGAFTVVDVEGEVILAANGEERALKVDERLRAEATFKTARLSNATIEFSNGVVLRVGSRSEVEVDEYWQQPHLQSAKVSDMKEEPSPSRTLLRLVSGDLVVSVKPLLVARGSTFHLELVAGTLRMTEGTLRARVQMTEVGIGYCSLELQSGSAEFERVGGAFAPVPVGRLMAFAVEVNRVTGAVKVGEMPK